MSELDGVATAKLLGASAILVAGVIDDLRSKKFHNWLFLVCSGFALLLLFGASGVSALPMGAFGFLAGLVIMMPVVLLNIVGAGDMKLLAAFGILAGWPAVGMVAVHAFVWGAAFGVLRVLINRQGRALLANLVSVVSLKERKNLELHKMPFAIAIFMGWLSYLVTQRII